MNARSKKGTRAASHDQLNNLQPHTRIAKFINATWTTLINLSDVLSNNGKIGLQQVQKPQSGRIIPCLFINKF